MHPKCGTLTLTCPEDNTSHVIDDFKEQSTADSNLVDGTLEHEAKLDELEQKTKPSNTSSADNPCPYMY